MAGNGRVRAYAEVPKQSGRGLDTGSERLTSEHPVRRSPSSTLNKTGPGKQRGERKAFENAVRADSGSDRTLGPRVSARDGARDSSRRDHMIGKTRHARAPFVAWLGATSLKGV